MLNLFSPSSRCPRRPPHAAAARRPRPPRPARPPQPQRSAPTPPQPHTNSHSTCSKHNMQHLCLPLPPPPPSPRRTTRMRCPRRWWAGSASTPSSPSSDERERKRRGNSSTCKSGNINTCLSARCMCAMFLPLGSRTALPPLARRGGRQRRRPSPQRDGRAIEKSTHLKCDVCVRVDSFRCNIALTL